MPTLNRPEYADLDRAFFDYDARQGPENLLQLEIAEIVGRDERIRWRDLHEVPRLVVLGEARAGKSEELRSQQRQLTAAGQLAYYTQVGDLDSEGLRATMTHNGVDGLARWQEQRGRAHLFIDSIDQARLTGHELDSALAKISQVLSEEELERLRIVLSCRYTDWRIIEDSGTIRRHLLPRSSTADVRVVVLYPLDRKQIRTLASEFSLRNADQFLARLKDTGAETFAGRPGDLLWLMQRWDDEDDIGSLTEVLETSIKRFLREEGTGRPSLTIAPHVNRRAVELLAGVLTLSGTEELCHRIDGTPKVGTNGLGLEPDEYLPDLTPDQLRDVLASRVFDPATFGRVRFRHRTVQEYLAARWLHNLVEDHLPPEALHELFFVEILGRIVVRPSMAAVAAWLAPRYESIRRQLLHSAPQRLIQEADPGCLSDDVRIQVLRNYIEHFSDRSRVPDSFDGATLQRFASPALANTISALLGEVPADRYRVLLLRMVQHGQLRDCRGVVLKIAISGTSSPYIRSRAIDALVTLNQHADTESLLAHYQERKEIEREVLISLVRAHYPRTLGIAGLLSLLRRSTSPRPGTSGGYLEFELIQLVTHKTRPPDLLTIIDRLRDLVLEMLSQEDRVTAHIELLYRLYHAMVGAQAHNWQAGDDTTRIERALHEAAGDLSQKLNFQLHSSSLLQAIREQVVLRRTLFERMVEPTSGAPWIPQSLRLVWQPEVDDATWLLDLVQSAPSIRVRESALMVLIQHSRLRPSTTLEDLASLVLGTPQLAAHVDHALERYKRSLPARLQNEDDMQKRAEDDRLQSEALAQDAHDHLVDIRSGEDVERLLALFLHAMQQGYPRPDDIEATLSKSFGYEIVSAAVMGMSIAWRRHWMQPYENDWPTREFCAMGAELAIRRGIDFESLDSESVARAFEVAFVILPRPPDWTGELALAHPLALRRLADEFITDRSKSRRSLSESASRLCQAPRAVRDLCRPLFWTLVRSPASLQSESLRGLLSELYSAAADQEQLRTLCRSSCVDENDAEYHGAWWSVWFRMEPVAALRNLQERVRCAPDGGRKVVLAATTSLAVGADTIPDDGQSIATLWSLIEDLLLEAQRPPREHNATSIVVRMVHNRLLDALSSVRTSGGVDALTELARRHPSYRDGLLERAELRLGDEAQGRASKVSGLLLIACQRHGTGLSKRAPEIIGQKSLDPSIPRSTTVIREPFTQKRSSGTAECGMQDEIEKLISRGNDLYFEHFCNDPTTGERRIELEYHSEWMLDCIRCLGRHPETGQYTSRIPEPTSEKAFERTLQVLELAKCVLAETPSHSGVDAMKTHKLSTDVLLVVVTDVERNAVVDAAAAVTGVPKPPLVHCADRTYHDLGTIGGARVLMVQSEMGTATVGGSLSTIQTAIGEISPASVIMVGIAFGVDPEEQPIGRILVSQKVQQYEMQRIGTAKNGGRGTINPRGDKVTATPRILSRLRAAASSRRDLPTEFGLMLSGEKLVDNVNYRESLRRSEPEAIGGEMEGGGLYVAATEKGVGWCIVKAVCDYADGKKHRSKGTRQQQAAENAAGFVLEALGSGGFQRDLGSLA